MEDKDQGGKQDQLDKRGLPGTNQAGKGPTKPDADVTPRVRYKTDLPAKSPYHGT